jgi:hypothetical protein
MPGSNVCRGARSHTIAEGDANRKGSFMTELDSEAIRQIQSAAKGTNQIPASQVRGWLRHPSVEVLGAVTQHIVRQSWRVEPPLSMEEICSAVQEYYKQCLVQNLQNSEYAPNRSVAGLELVGWFRSLWRDPAVPREYLARLKTMLRDLLIKRKVPQDQLVGAVLEHLFETPEIAELFADWKSDALLSTAFDLAMDWAKDHRPPSVPQT